MHRHTLIAWLDRVTTDVQSVMAYETVFSEVQRMIRTNRNFRGKPGRFNQALFALVHSIGGEQHPAPA